VLRNGKAACCTASSEVEAEQRQSPDRRAAAAIAATRPHCRLSIHPLTPLGSFCLLPHLHCSFSLQLRS
jgi:hypothetical protein